MRAQPASSQNARRLTKTWARATAALITQLADPDAAAVQAAWAALGDITSALPKDNLHVYVRCVRDAVASARDKVRVPRFRALSAR